MKITITSWDRYNPRKDVKSASWFRMENNLFDDEDLFDFTCEGKCIWLYILCKASRKMRGTIRFNISQCATVLSVDGATVQCVISTLQEFGMIVVDSEKIDEKQQLPESDRNAIESDRKRHATNERTDERNEQNERTNNAPARVDRKFNDWDLKVAEMQQAAMLKFNPDLKRANEADLDDWADVYRKMRTLDKRPIEQIEKLLNYVYGRADDFWRSTIQTAGGIRKNFDTISGQMLRKGERSYADIAAGAAEQLETMPKDDIPF